jgi:hypothetical protein
MKDGRNH